MQREQSVPPAIQRARHRRLPVVYVRRLAMPSIESPPPPDWSRILPRGGCRFVEINDAEAPDPGSRAGQLRQREPTPARAKLTVEFHADGLIVVRAHHGARCDSSGSTRDPAQARRLVELAIGEAIAAVSPEPAR